MAKVALMTIDKAPACDPPAGSSGPIQSQAFFDQERDPIHVHLHRLGAGATLRIGEAPTDRLVYVWDGAVAAGETPLAKGAGALIEGGASLTVTASGEGTELVIYDAAQRDADDVPGGHVRLLPSDRVPRIEKTAGLNIGSALFADSRSPSSQVWMHESEMREANDLVVLHSHTEDEVIFVTAGQIRLGNKLYDPGTAIAIAADTKYEFTTGPEGLTFINFRNKTPTYTSADGKLVVNEADFFIANVGSPDYIDVPSS